VGDPTPARRHPFRLLTETFRVVVIDDLAGGLLNLQPLPSAVRWLGRAGLALVGALMVLTVLFYLRRAQVTRNWVFVPVASAQMQESGQMGEAVGADRPAVTSLALSFAGPVGLPPSALPLSLVAIALGWGMALSGARRASPLVYYPLLLVYAAHQVLIASLTEGLWAWLPLALLLAWLAGSYWVGRRLAPAYLWLEVLLVTLLTGALYGALWLAGESQQMLSAGLVASQVIMLFLLTTFWLLLGSDTVDAAVSVGRWLAGLITRGISLRVARWLIPLVLVAKIALTLVFAPTLLADAAVTSLLLVAVLILGVRGRYDETALVFVAALTVVSTVVVYYAALAWAGTSVVESLLFVVPPVATFAFFVVWDMLGKGADFVDGDSARLPRPARLLLLLGWVMLATTCMFFFFAARDDAFEAFAERVAAEAVLVSGLPFALYLLLNRTRQLTGLSAEDDQPTPDRVPGWAFVLLALLIVATLAATTGLTTVQFAQAAILTNRADLMAVDQPEEAEHLYQSALAANPSYYKGHFNLGTFYFERDRVDEAIAQFEAAIEANEELLQAHLNLAVSLSAADRDEEAEAVLERVLEVDPKFAYAHNNLGLLYLTRAEWAQAKHYLDQALQYATEERPEYYQNLAAAEWELGYWEEAEDHLRRALELDPESSDAYLALGVMYNAWGTLALLEGNPEAAAERYERSRTAYEDALEQGADGLLVGTNLSQLYLDLGELEQAEDLVRETLVDYPDNANLHNILGIILYQADRIDEARTAFQAAKAIDAGYPYAWAGEALLDLERGEWAAAATGYEAALRLGLDRDYVRYNLGLSYTGMGRYEEAIHQFEAVIDLDAQYILEARRQIAEALLELGRTEEAIATYREVIELDPGAPKPYVNLGSALALSGDIAAAEEAYRTATELDPNLLEAHVGLGEVLAYRGDVEGAAAEFDIALALNPAHPTANFRRGMLYYSAEDYETAIPYFDAAIAADPSWPNPYAFLGLCHALLGNTEIAVQAFEAGLAVCGDPDTCALFQEAIDDLRE
jgi:tetratricopeptide (TPR) repeat protein